MGVLRTHNLWAAKQAAAVGAEREPKGRTQRAPSARRSPRPAKGTLAPAWLLGERPRGPGALGPQTGSGVRQEEERAAGAGPGPGLTGSNPAGSAAAKWVKSHSESSPAESASSPAPPRPHRGDRTGTGGLPGGRQEMRGGGTELRTGDGAAAERGVLVSEHKGARVPDFCRSLSPPETPLPGEKSCWCESLLGRRRRAGRSPVPVLPGPQPSPGCWVEVRGAKGAPRKKEAQLRFPHSPTSSSLSGDLPLVRAAQVSDAATSP